VEVKRHAPVLNELDLFHPTESLDEQPIHKVPAGHLNLIVVRENTGFYKTTVNVFGAEMNEEDWD
jgi:hypothetical protein